MANPVNSLASILQSAQVAQQGQIPDAKPTSEQHAVPQDTVSISKSGAAASQAQAASKSGQASGGSDSGEAK
jgi:hypothetical protein